MTDSGASPRAVLLAVDDDPGARARLVDELWRYERDYDVMVLDSG